MSGSIINSSAVTNYIMQNRDQFRKGALESITAMNVRSRGADFFIDGMMKAMELSGFQLSVDWTIAVTDRIRVFIGNPDEVLAKLQELPRKKVSILPQKVVVKMLALRLQKVWYQHRDYVTMVNEHNNISEMRRPLYNLKFPDFSTPDELSHFLEGQSSTLGSHWKLNEKVGDLKEFLKEQGHLLDDSIVKEAWAMVQVREVMES